MTERIGDDDMATGTISFEIELVLTGTIVPYSPATPPTYDSAGDPPEGGYAEDVQIEDIGIVSLVPASERERGSHPRGVWKTTSVLDGVDTSNVEIQKLLSNILLMKAGEACEAVYDAGLE